jgi:hypothetical protein
MKEMNSDTHSCTVSVFPRRKMMDEANRGVNRQASFGHHVQPTRPTKRNHPHGTTRYGTTLGAHSPLASLAILALAGCRLGGSKGFWVGQSRQRSKHPRRPLDPPPQKKTHAHTHRHTDGATHQGLLHDAADVGNGQVAVLLPHFLPASSAAAPPSSRDRPTAAAPSCCC